MGRFWVERVEPAAYDDSEFWALDDDDDDGDDEDDDDDDNDMISGRRHPQPNFDFIEGQSVLHE